jgi:hypothetical protein
MDNIKVGDRFFITVYGESHVILLDYKTPEGDWNCDCEAVGNILYDHEIADLMYNRRIPIIKIENDFHLLQLKLKYS